MAKEKNGVKAEPIETPKEELVAEVESAPAKDPNKEFIAKKLKIINEMSNQAKARYLAERVLANNRKVVK